MPEIDHKKIKNNKNKIKIECDLFKNEK